MSYRVRRSTYRGRSGWLVYESPSTHAFRQRIFSERETEAQRMARQLNAGEGAFFDLHCHTCGATSEPTAEAYFAGWSLTECPAHRRQRIAALAEQKENEIRSRA